MSLVANKYLTSFLRFCYIINLLFTQYTMLEIINTKDATAAWGWAIAMWFFFAPLIILGSIVLIYRLIQREKKISELRYDITILACLIAQNVSFFIFIPKAT